MKTKKIIYFALMFLPLLITVAALPFLPEKIPAHYNFAGEIDRWGSKFETLIFPAVTIAMGFFMLFMAKVAAKDENGKTNEKIVFYTGMGISLWFTVMHCFSIYKAFSAAGSMGFSANVDINSLFCVLMGRSCDNRPLHAETPQKFTHRPSNFMEHEKRNNMGKEPAFRRNFLHGLRCAYDCFRTFP